MKVVVEWLHIGGGSGCCCNEGGEDCRCKRGLLLLCCNPLVNIPK